MELDDELCLCFHVTRRKVVNFIRIEKPRRPSQLSQCFGAGTGCGWCRPMLTRLLRQAQDQNQKQNLDLNLNLNGLTKESGIADDAIAQEQKMVDLDSDSTTYASLRQKYIDGGHGTPPST